MLLALLQQPWGLVFSKLQGNNLRLWLNVRISLDFDAIFSGKPLPFATNLSILCAVYHAQYSKYERHKRMVPSRRGHFIKVQFYWWQHWHGGHLRFFVIKYVAQIRLKHGKHSRIGLSIYYDEMKANYTNALMRVGGYFWDFSTCVRLVPSIWREGDSPKKTIVAIKFLQQALFLEVFLSEL